MSAVKKSYRFFGQGLLTQWPNQLITTLFVGQPRLHRVCTNMCSCAFFKFQPLLDNYYLFHKKTIYIVNQGIIAIIYFFFLPCDHVTFSPAGLKSQVLLILDRKLSNGASHGLAVSHLFHWMGLSAKWTFRRKMKV